MTDIIKDTNEKIGGFGFTALKYWHGKHITNLFDQGGVWRFLQTRAIALSQNESPVDYTPSIANISLVYCMENKIDSIHIYPRQSNMTTTALLYMYYLIESTNGNCLIYYLTRNRQGFLLGVDKLLSIITHIDGSDKTMHDTVSKSLNYHSCHGMEYVCTSSPIICPKLDDDQFNRLKNTCNPVYVIVEDALYFYSWEKHLSRLQELKNNNYDITLICMSTLNQRVDTDMRKSVQCRLLLGAPDVFLNDEIYYNPIPASVDIEIPAIIRTDYKYLHKDKSKQFVDRMRVSLGDDSQAMMSEVYLQYESIPVAFIGR